MKDARSGHSLVESCIVISLTCLIFFGLLQISLLSVGREVLHHAAARGVRAKAVGFNWWMVEKAIRVAAIPNAGPMTQPEFENIDLDLQRHVAEDSAGALWGWALGQTPESRQYAVERGRIPGFLGADNQARAYQILDYERWDSIQGLHPDSPAGPDGAVVADPVIEVAVSQDFLLWTPFRALYYSEESASIETTSSMENHYPLYIDDYNW